MNQIKDIPKNITDKYIPIGLFIIANKYEQDCYYIVTDDFIKDLHIIRYSLSDRLIQIKQMLHEHRKDFKNFFFKEDFDIIKSLDISSIDNETQKFVNLIIHENHIKYKSKPSNKIDILINLIKEQQIDRKVFTHLTKWMTLDKNKLSTLKSNKIYASFPEQFNDVFDSQIRCDTSTKKYLSNKFLSHKYIDGDPDPIPIEDRRIRIIELYQEQLNDANICCFSLLNPLNIKSNHMWGLYANCGKGIALKYKIDDMIEFFIKKSKKLRRELGINRIDNMHYIDYIDYCRIMPVKYHNTNNILPFFEKYIQLIVNYEFNAKKDHEVIFDYFRTKTVEWQYEQEVRLISLNYTRAKNHEEFTHNYLNNSKNTIQQEIIKQKQDFDKTIEFIAPETIFFGWNYKENPKGINNTNNEYDDLLLWLQTNNSIKYKLLKKEINYLKNCFISDE